MVNYSTDDRDHNDRKETIIWTVYVIECNNNNSVIRLNQVIQNYSVLTARKLIDVCCIPSWILLEFNLIDCYWKFNSRFESMYCGQSFMRSYLFFYCMHLRHHEEATMAVSSAHTTNCKWEFGVSFTSRMMFAVMFSVVWGVPLIKT